MTVLAGRAQLQVFRALLSPAAMARQPACRVSQQGILCVLGSRLDSALLVLSSPFYPHEQIIEIPLKICLSSFAALDNLICSGPVIPWVIPLGTPWHMVSLDLDD